jgi:hypothetical protein
MKTCKLGKFIFAILLFILEYVNSATNASKAIMILEQLQENQNIANIVAVTIITDEKPKKIIGKYIRGIHLSAWLSGSKQHRKIAMDLFDNTELNTAVIDVKEYEGHIYLDNIKIGNTTNDLYVSAIPDLESYISKLKTKNIYTIARIVVFKDNAMARRNPELAIKNPDGTIWTDKKNIAWLDPYNTKTWDYNLQIAERAANIGFDEIQFDYIRFPSDGNTKNCRYSKPHSTYEASKTLVGFLKKANKHLKSKGVNISIDLFGLTTTAETDMGIGQKIIEMAEWVDYVSPMVYPSHYSKLNYDITEPNKEPYKTVYYAISGALKRIPSEKLRPWLQDFSLGYKYDKNEVRAQIQACYDNKIGNWLLWNPRCVYTKAALKGKAEENFYQKSDPPTPEMLKNINEKTITR